MLKTLKNILLIIGTFLIVFPAIANFVHIFKGHDHGLCDNYADAHIHHPDLDCKLHKFHKTPAIQFTVNDFQVILIEVPVRHFFSFYEFLSEYQRIHFKLRGPPALV